MTACIVAGCDRQATYAAACMCQLHYYRQKTHGSTDKPQREVMSNAEKQRRGLAAGLAAAVEFGDCLEWQGKYACRGATPVVAFHDTESRQTRNASVPILLWEQEHGPVPAGKIVYRKCCNNACVLVEHLACGTRADWQKARRKAGVNRHSAVAKLHLTAAARKRATTVNSIEKAREVRSLASAKVKTADIARITGVHPEIVAEIRQGRAWRETGSVWSGLGG